MTAKKKPRWHTRAAKSVQAHPWITWGTLASVATILPVLFAGGAWFFGHFQTVAAAELHEKQDAREFAGVLYGQQRIETLLLRNKLNDCNAKIIKPTERAACDQYKQEYREAQQRTQFLYQKTQEAGK